MIRQFRPGVWIDPDEVLSAHVSIDRYQVLVRTFTGQLQLNTRQHDDTVALADEIGTAARVAQEARLAADTRLHREVPIPSPAEQAGAHMKCPECGSVDRLPQFPADDDGRSE